ncbi:MAG: class I SAM-dependent methyltransferase [Candidatus Kapabacteria bacterium]|nr:class I SAM-dependent methyltransferase [Candidatus Kapabacteria bacterium]
MTKLEHLKDQSIKTDGYYIQTRHEMLKFIPQNAGKILDVGCGEGQFGLQLKQLLNAEVWGMELDEKSAKVAESRIDKVLIGDLTLKIDSLPNEYFDCIIFNDILEHLVDPYNTLLNIKQKLNRDGVVVSSIPNVRYISNLKKLLFDKDWKYEDEGILDKTHLRFFTKKSIIDMFELLGFDIIQMEGINPSKSKNLKLANFLLMGNLEDTKYLQYASVTKPK